MKLYDSESGLEVGYVREAKLHAIRCDVSYDIEGYAVVDSNGHVGPVGAVVGTFDDGKLCNYDGKLMAASKSFAA